MVGIKIYEWNTDTAAYDLKYTALDCNEFEVSKNSGVIPFSLAVVDTDQDTSGRVINEKTDLIRISGVDAQVSVSFEISISDIQTMLNLVSNRIGKKHKIDVEDWSGDLANYSFIGLISNIRLIQAGGDPKLMCGLTFYEGDNIFFDLTI